MAHGGGGGVRVGKRDAEDGVGTQLLFVGGAVEVDERGVERGLVERVGAAERGGDGFVDGFDRLPDTLAAVTVFVAVAQLPGLVLAGGRSAGHGGAPADAAFEENFDLDRGVAARVEDFEGADVGDGGEIGGHKKGGCKQQSRGR